jgi:hypothetical protein
MRRGNTILCHSAIARYLLFASMIGVEKQQPLKSKKIEVAILLPISFW